MKLQFDFGKVIQMDNLFGGEKYEKLKRSLVTIMQHQKDKLFQSSKDPDGNAWAPISKLSADRKIKKNKKSSEEIAKLHKVNPAFEDHKILVDTGALMKSLMATGAKDQVSSTTGNEVMLGTNVEYAAVHNFGMTIESTGTKIVARPFIGFGANDDEEITNKLEAYLKKGAL